MNFLADENIDQQIVQKLRNEGCEVIYIAELDPGISDDLVIDQANEKQALLLTADKDFGELVFRQKRIYSGVILVRLAGLSPVMKAEAILTAIREHGGKFSGAFTVLSPGMIRIRKEQNT